MRHLSVANIVFSQGHVTITFVPWHRASALMSAKNFHRRTNDGCCMDDPDDLVVSSIARPQPYQPRFAALQEPLAR